MKTFTKQEVRDLFNKVIMDEVSFTRMVEIMNERVSERVRVSESEKPCVEDIPEEPKEGDLAIFWDESKEYAIITVYKQFHMCCATFPHQDHMEGGWKNAIKFESKEQYERLIKGEI